MNKNLTINEKRSGTTSGLRLMTDMTTTMTHTSQWSVIVLWVIFQRENVTSLCQACRKKMKAALMIVKCSSSSVYNFCQSSSHCQTVTAAQELGRPRLSGHASYLYGWTWRNLPPIYYERHHRCGTWTKMKNKTTAVSYSILTMVRTETLLHTQCI